MDWKCAKCGTEQHCMTRGYNTPSVGRTITNGYLCLSCGEKIREDLGNPITKEEYLKWLKRRYKRK